MAPPRRGNEFSGGGAEKVPLLQARCFTALPQHLSVPLQPLLGPVVVRAHLPTCRQIRLEWLCSRREPEGTGVSRRIRKSKVCSQLGSQENVSDWHGCQAADLRRLVTMSLEYAKSATGNETKKSRRVKSGRTRFYTVQGPSENDLLHGAGFGRVR